MSLLLLLKGGGTSAQTLTPSLYTNTQTFFSATITTGPVDLQSSLYTNTQTFFAATVAPGPVNLLPSLYTNDQTFYSPTVVVDGGPQTLLPDLYVNAQTFFAPTVSQAVAPVVNVFNGDIGPPVRRKRKQREFDDERAAREKLRADIQAAIEPVKDAPQATVLASQQDVEAGVAVVASGGTVTIPVPPEFSAAQVAQMVAAELERVNVVVRREAARQALEAMIVQEKARLRRRQLEDEEIMLFN